ncbi:hypothetical protein OOT46_13275 [Aquabacterium sp. A7-Y]|uniref:hypothetical protein n=1 Tax=Aquabacterium sp. A7-Y TaxID=1349605 RepID=UPI00223E85CB|nr:hypothetical protein [Aquabacterium sp. A7-Y]MCW7538813.1 hypothetical protein [Aquabacterium sp. A7-Y]
MFLDARLAPASAFVLLVLLPACDGGQDTDKEAASPPPGARSPLSASGHGAAAIGNRSGATRQVQLIDGRLTLQVHEQPLSTVLATIATQAGITIELAPDLGARPITADMRDLPLTQGLLWLLRDFDVLLAMRSGASLQAAWVYPRGRGPQGPAVAVAAAVHASVEAPTQRCDAGSAAPGLADKDVTADPQQLAQDVLSTDPRVRQRALDRSLTQQMPLPPAALHRLATEDPDAGVRTLAVTALTHGPQAPAVAVHAALQRALQDQDAALRERAKELLEQFEMAALPNEATPQPQTPADADPP